MLATTVVAFQTLKFMIFWYTARNKFNSQNSADFGWAKYIEWSKLTHLKELISLDSSLCDLAFDIDPQNENIYDYLIIDKFYSTDLFNNIDYVLNNVKGKSNINLLAVVKEPEEECNSIQLKDFIFLGYDLMDIEYTNSALTNCGGFDETFLPTDLNEFGLVDNLEKALIIQKSLRINNPEEHHADCNLFAIWRKINFDHSESGS
jgi:hypothetical protein